MSFKRCSGPECSQVIYSGRASLLDGTAQHRANYCTDCWRKLAAEADSRAEADLKRKLETPAQSNAWTSGPGGQSELRILFDAQEAERERKQGGGL